MDVGDKAPAISVTASDGTELNLASPGVPQVLYFYPKDDTSGCTREAQDFTALAPEFARAGVTVIGVSKDSVASHRKFASKYDLAVKLASDPTGATVERYGSWVEKSLYGRKYMGVSRKTFLIDEEGRLRKVFDKVKVDEHADEVLKAFDEPDA